MDENNAVSVVEDLIEPAKTDKKATRTPLRT